MKKLIISLALLLTTWAAALAQVTEIDDIWDIKYNNRPMVIEAYATWCPPCKTYSPTFARLAREYQGKVDFYKVNVDNPDAEDFIDRYEINSVPTTVFLWDPNGDATVKHSVEHGLMSYNELKRYIDDTLAKQYRFQAQNIPAGSLSWGQFNPDAFYVYTDINPSLRDYVGEWTGYEDGCETKLWLFADGNEMQVVGGTLSPKRQQLVDTVYWISLGAGWEDNENALYISDILPDVPSSPFSGFKSGTLRERKLTLNGSTLSMSVKVFNAINGQCESNPPNTYTVTYNKTN